MRFTAEHRFPGPPAAVAAVLGDPDFYRALELPDLQLLEVRRLEEPGAAAPRGGRARDGLTTGSGLVLRYEYTGSLDGVALRLLGGERLTWSQEVRLFGDSGGQLVFSAEADPHVLHGRADFVLEAVEAVQADAPGEHVARVSTVRRLEGELTVSLPVVGGMAERRIVPGVLERLDVEASAARQRLERRPGGAGAPHPPR